VIFGVRCVRVVDGKDFGDPFHISLGSFYSDGKTAEMEKDAINDKCLGHQQLEHKPTPTGH